jgi:DNA-binding NarL/FixJ family response regulator
MSCTPPAFNSLGNGSCGDAGLKPQVPEPHEIAPQSMHKLKTYIVEDSAVIRQSLIATLEELVPVEVVGTAEDELTAVQWLTGSKNNCDLVIIDIFLKGGSGLGVLRSVNGAAQRYNLVVLSNYATSDIRRKCLELGADRVFDKSNEIDGLIQYCSQLAAGESGNGLLA